MTDLDKLLTYWPIILAFLGAIVQGVMAFGKLARLEEQLTNIGTKLDQMVVRYENVIVLTTKLELLETRLSQLEDRLEKLADRSTGHD